ncbi:MAG: DUF2142 domain-containing protein [Clostridia bacterium]|nr:DUF2142 domain-containing protein [Clostridia bacterium]
MIHTKKRLLHLACCILICALALTLVCLTVRKTAEPEIALDTEISLSELAVKGGENGLTVAFDESAGTLTLTAGETDGSLALPEAYRTLNVLFLQTDAYTYNILTAPYTQSGEVLANATEAGAPLEDGRHVFFFQTPVEGSIRLNVLAGSSVTVRAAHAMQITGYDFGYDFNLIPLVALAAIALLLLPLERKFGFYKWLGGCFKNAYLYARELLKTRHVCVFLLHLLAKLALVCFVAMAMADLALGITSPVYTLALLIAASLAIAGAIADACVVKKNARPALLVLISILILGATLTITEPLSMQTSWDDGYHFANTSYSPALLTNGGKIPLAFFDFACEHYNGGDYRQFPEATLGNVLHFGDLPTAAIDLAPTLEMLGSLDWYLYLLAIPALPFVLLYFLFIYIAYAPGIVAIFFGSALGADFFQLFLLGKLINTLCYALLVYFAVRKLKSGAYLFSAIALLPICVFLGASYSCDWWITGATLLGLAYFFSILQNKERPATRLELIVMITALAFACGPKEIYFLLMTPLLFIPHDRFSRRRSAILTKLIVVLVMLAILLSFAVPMFIDTGSSTDLRGGSDVNSAEQVKFILTNPIKYADICINFIKDYVSLSSMSTHVPMYAWLGIGNQIYALIAILVLFFCTFTDRTANDNYRRSWIIRAVGLFVGFAQIVLVATALYVSYTPVGFHTVNGCQYRYLFPIFPLMLYCFMPMNVENKMSDRVKCAVVFGLLALSNLAAYYDVYISLIV